MSQKSASRRNICHSSNSQRNVSQSTIDNRSQKSRADDMTEEQFEAAVINVTNFLLCDMRYKRKIRKEDVVTNALNKSARQYAAILKRVDSNLSNVFGLKRVKITEGDDAFIIVNKNKEMFTELTQSIRTEEEVQDDLVLTVVLSTIFMNRGFMYQSHVMALLENSGLLKDGFFLSSNSHRTKDHVLKLVKHVFVKQLYLETLTVPRPDQVQVPELPQDEKKVTILQWGFRAYLEVDVEKIVDYLVKMFDGRKPPGFPATYYLELAAKQREVRAQANVF